MAPEDETLVTSSEGETLRLELYLAALRLIGALAAVNTVPPRGDGLRLRAAELMTEAQHCFSMWSEVYTEWRQRRGQTTKRSFFCISPDSWTGSFAQIKSNLLTSVANPCLSPSPTSAPGM